MSDSKNIIESFDREIEKSVKTLMCKSFSKSLDLYDSLKRFRDEFSIPKVSPHKEKDKDSIYLCGNSLGCMPKRAQKYVEEEIQKWSLSGVEGHFSGDRPWVPIDEKCSELLMPLVGAKKINEIVVMNTLSVNCHLFLISFYQPTKNRFKILMEAQAFCSDHHIIRSQLRLHGYSESNALIQVAPRKGESCVRTEDVLRILDEQGERISLVFLGGVNFFTGQLFDMKNITLRAHKIGAYVGFDLAHCVGNIPVQLHEWDVDFAIWCHYKYVNSGPGCIAGAFLHDKYSTTKDLKRLDGWWGQAPDDRFKMDRTHCPKLGAQAYMMSNPPVLPTVCLQASLEIFSEAGIEELRTKSKYLTGYLECLVENFLPEIKILTPRNPEKRGCQLSLEFPIDIEVIYSYLTKIGIICDVRRPNVVRIAPTPLYNKFSDVFEFIQKLTKVRDLLHFEYEKKFML